MKKLLSRIFPKKGSALIFAMITLTAMMIVAIASYEASMVNQRTATDTEKSVSSFQAADSGVEIVMKKLNTTLTTGTGPTTTITAAFAGNINASTCTYEDNSSLTGRKIKVEFLDLNGAKIPSADCGTKTLADIKELKSTGEYGGTIRAVNVAVAASTEDVYQIACIDASQVMCCRLTKSTGLVTCKTTNGASWADEGTPFSASATSGSYGISLAAGSFYRVCRMNAVAGTAECKEKIGSWVNIGSGNPW